MSGEGGCGVLFRGLSPAGRSMRGSCVGGFDGHSHAAPGSRVPWARIWQRPSRDPTFLASPPPTQTPNACRREEAQRRAAEAQGRLGSLDEEARRKEAEAADLDRQLEALRRDAAAAEHRRWAEVVCCGTLGSSVGIPGVVLLAPFGLFRIFINALRVRSNMLHQTPELLAGGHAAASASASC